MTLIQAIWHQLQVSLVSLVYPSRCVHCDEITSYDQPFLCPNCVSLLELIQPKDRCISCFGAIGHGPNRRCKQCQKGHHLFQGLAAAFDYVGPAASLIKRLKYGNQPYLAEGLGAFLVAQFDQLNWPLPDGIVPVPLSFTHWLDRGYNQSLLLANEMAKLLNVPVLDVLTRESGDYSQAGLSLVQRKSLEGKKFKLKPHSQIEDKTLLLVDDVLTTGSTFNRCAEVLVRGYPARLYGMTCCRAL